MVFCFDTLTRGREKIICLNGGPRTVKDHAFEWQARAWDAIPAKDALRPFERAYPGQGVAVQERLMQAPRTQPKYVSTCASHQEGARTLSASCETRSGNKGNTRRKTNPEAKQTAACAAVE